MRRGWQRKRGIHQTKGIYTLPNTSNPSWRRNAATNKRNFIEQNLCICTVAAMLYIKYQYHLPQQQQRRLILNDDDGQSSSPRHAILLRRRRFVMVRKERPFFWKRINLSRVDFDSSLFDFFILSPTIDFIYSFSRATKITMILIFHLFLSTSSPLRF